MNTSHRTIATIGLIVLGIISMIGLMLTFWIDKTLDANVIDTFKLVTVACVTAVAGLVQTSSNGKEE